ncbi:alpha/beta hydrolase family protein [Aspergillus ruber CBS 135680]|uniref:Prolyl endopeptidase n=1 Tax=Aspergillus ruber (strain CBS 135680) TaxID=1388766 RepID=A0A017S6U3_ASPRC|nr:alpha/beta-hydrolase [Aspergillus ruber CBS 135680]EYE92667.1 alpha/beta-hydrolase [Aspergillus ruber CBS 135680]
MGSSPNRVSYGHWTSPLTAEQLAHDRISLHEVVVNESTGAIYSIECIPTENGRYTIIEHYNGKSRNILPKESGLSAQANVHDLGGGSMAISPDGKVTFSDEKTCHVYQLDPAVVDAGNGFRGGTTLVHAADQGIRYADFCHHPTESQWVLAIREDQRDATPETQAYNVHNVLVALNTDTREEKVVAAGDDFYAHPKFDPSGRYASWIQWSHPDMPWTGTVLYLADWGGSQGMTNVRKIAGKAMGESIAQPKWGLDGALWLASDRTGFWQLYSVNPEDESCQVRQLVLKGLEDAEMATAEWDLGNSTYISLDESTIVAAAITHATGRVILIDTATASFQDLDLPYLDIDGVYRVTPTSFAIIGSSADSPPELALVSLTSNIGAKPRVQQTVLKSTASAFTLPPEYISHATSYTAPQNHGPLRNGSVHFFYFPPRNPHFHSDNTLPPCLVYVHGGPNSNATPALDLETQYYTTRGFAVAAVNYTGSTGFGREYRERFSGYWGLADVADTVSVVDYLVQNQMIDQSRVGIYGGSAGGYLTLRALHMYPGTWAAGISNYGISDVRALQADSYKFESQDVDRLLLSLTQGTEEREAELTKRSPCHFAKDIKAPLLLLQGTEDVVVPVAQARMMANAMHECGNVAEVVEFPGEGHGWVGKEAIYESLRRKEEWWRTYLG